MAARQHCRWQPWGHDRYDYDLARAQRIALVAHDDRKGDLLEWAEYNRDILANHVLYATGTTGRLLGETLDLPVTCFQSGPLGGDQQIGALIASGQLDMLIFFWDPMSPQPHDSDVKALVRIAVVWNIPIACNRTSADYLITSPLLGQAAITRRPLRSASAATAHAISLPVAFSPASIAGINAFPANRSFAQTG